MGVTEYFRIFKHNNKLHIHNAFCAVPDLKPWFISKDDVIDKSNNVCERDPETVNNAFDGNRLFSDIISIYHSRFDEFHELYSTVKPLLTKRDLKIFINKIRELFSDKFIYDYFNR